LRGSERRPSGALAKLATEDGEVSRAMMHRQATKTREPAVVHDDAAATLQRSGERVRKGLSRVPPREPLALTAAMSVPEDGGDLRRG